MTACRREFEGMDAREKPGHRIVSRGHGKAASLAELAPENLFDVLQPLFQVIGVFFDSQRLRKLDGVPKKSLALL